MKVKQVQHDSAEIELSADDLLLIANALNEICNGLAVPEFATRIGAERDQALKLLQDIQKVYDRVAPQTVGRQ